MPGQLFALQRVMDILLFTIVKSPGAVTLTETTKKISKDGANIGRGSNNNWILPDPERYLSSIHTEIIYKNETFFAIDQSTNGTFYNDSPKEIGKGNEVELHDGDRLIIGDYEIEVSLWQEDDSVSLDGPFAASNEQVAVADASYIPSNIPMGDDLIPMNDAPLSMGVSQHLSNDSPLFEDDAILDPLIALQSSEAIGDVFAVGTQGDVGDIMSHSIQLPDMIPDNWFDLPLPNSDEPLAINEAPVPEVAVSSSIDHRQKITSEINLEQEATADLSSVNLRPKPSVKNNTVEPQSLNVDETHSVTDNDSTNDNSQASSTQNQTVSANEELIAALGLNIEDMDAEQISDINNVVGEFTQIAVKGLMLILKSRSSLKSEFRMNVTTIQSAENNPLKFSPTLEDAMFNMFVRGGNAYKDPVTAVKEGIEGVADHQFSVFAGMRSAFNFLLERFNPQLLEAKFDKQKSNTLLASKKAKNWDLYSSFYQDIVKDRDDSFQYLFGDEFVQAYEQQMQQLKTTRANSKE